MRTRYYVWGLATGICLLAASFSMAAENLLKNPGMDQIGDGGTLKEWKHNHQVSLEKEGDNIFPRIACTVTGSYVSVSQDVPVKPDWESLTLIAKMRVNSIDEASVKKPGDVPRAMLVFKTPAGALHHRPLCHLADATDGKWIERWETIEIPPDSTSVGVVFDLSSSIASFDVDEVRLFVDAPRAAPMAVLESAGKFNLRRTQRMDTPPGWIVPPQFRSADNKQLMLENEGKERFLRVVNADMNQNVHLDNYFQLDPTWKKVKITAKIRAKGLVCGKEVYQDARVMVTFADAKGTHIGGYGEVPFVKADQDWKEVTATRDVPEGAFSIRLQPGLFGSTGTADFDDITVAKAD